VRKKHWKATVAYANGRYPGSVGEGARYNLVLHEPTEAGDVLWMLLADTVDRQMKLVPRNRHIEYITVGVWDTTISPPRVITHVSARFQEEDRVYVLKGTNTEIDAETFRGERIAADYDEWIKS
jgi:hypothetical protein